MEAFQIRMVEEYNELNQKIERLDDFINNNKIFKTLVEEEQRDMKQQLTGMLAYSVALERRLRRQSLLKEDT